MKGVLSVFCVVCALFNASPLLAQVQFEIKNAGLTVSGSFEKHSANISYDPFKPNRATFQGSIDASSIDTGIDLRDKHLKDEDYFDVANYPTMRYLSSKVTPLENGHLDVVGTLTIKGVSRDIQFVVVPEKTAAGWRFATEIELDRLEFGVGGKSWILANEVTCFIQETLN